MVSGGARGVTAQCVIELARQYHCQFVLLGRSSISQGEPAWAVGLEDEAELKRQIMQVLLAQGQKPKPLVVQRQYRAIKTYREIMGTLQAIEKVGGKAEYISVDVTNGEALSQVIAKTIATLGPITGIIHGAGALADKRIEQKTEQDFERVYNTKVTGLNNLLSSVEPEQLDFLILFSSFVGLYGNAGQADYALANEILNKSAHRLQQRYPNCKVVAIGWGPWDGGMVTAELKQHFAQLDMALIPPEFGAKVVVAELAREESKEPQLTVMSRPITLPTGSPYGNDYSHRVQRKITLAANPFVVNHVIGHQPVLPAMCGLGWIANLGEQCYPGYRFAEVQDFKVLKGIVFDETLAPLYRLDLTEKQSDKDTIILEAVVWSESARKMPRYHYRSRLRLLKDPAAQPSESLFVMAAVRSHPSMDVSSLYQDGTLFHQPAFQSIRSVLELDEKQLRCQCYLPTLDPWQQGQFQVQSFNPYTADVFFQGLLVWVRKQRGLASLPAQLKSLKQFKPLLFDQLFELSLEILAEDNSTVTANATARNASGEVCIQVEEMQVVKSPRLKERFLENVYSAKTVALAS